MSISTPPFDRRELVTASTVVNGVDFVEVGADLRTLTVHFLNPVPVAGTLAGLRPVTIVGGETVAQLTVLPLQATSAWSADNQGRPLLTVQVAGLGDSSSYTLAIDSTALDPYFASAQLTFAQPSAARDCASTSQTAASAPSPEPVPIDYLAKDFASFQQALSEFSALRYPAWVERSEADVGVVVMEALAAVADELSYYQDRVAGEATLSTATQALSMLHHARLVDYEPGPATVATTVLQLDVSAGPGAEPASWTIATPMRFQAIGADGSAVPFEVEDPTGGLSASVQASAAGNTPAWATVDPRWNRSVLSPRGPLSPYYWDESERCLSAGATTVDLLQHGLGLYAGQSLLLDTPSAAGAEPPTRELVTVASWTEITDPLASPRPGYPAPPIPLTRVSLAAMTTDDHDLDTTIVAGNIVPAVQGIRYEESFTIPADGAPSPAPVVVRLAANSTSTDPLPSYRYCLQNGPLAWLASGLAEEYSATPAVPEIVMSAVAPGGLAVSWQYGRWLLDSGPSDPVFTLTPEQYSPVLTADGTTWFDYDGDAGTTIRFGDGSFGLVPLPGTVVTITYRVGLGPLGNVPADTITGAGPGQPQPGSVIACTNPFTASGGAAAETAAQVRSRAPQRFGSELLRVLRPEDYVAAAQSLPWVQQAGAVFRWTGSWETAQTTADPIGIAAPSTAELQSLTGLLDARRMAGYDSYVRGPRYLAIDLEVVIAGLGTAFASDVEQAVITALAPGFLTNGQAAFFDHSRWGFGQSLEESALLAAIQACSGVVGVVSISYRVPNLSTVWRSLADALVIAPDQILRLDNDPSRPQDGALFITVQGAK